MACDRVLSRDSLISLRALSSSDAAAVNSGICSSFDFFSKRTRSETMAKDKSEKKEKKSKEVEAVVEDVEMGDVESKASLLV